METPPPEIYTLSLHDALPILRGTPAGLVSVEIYADDSASVSLLVDLARRGQGYGTRIMRAALARPELARDRKSTRLNSSHPSISYAVFCLKKKTGPEPVRWSS